MKLSVGRDLGIQLLAVVLTLALAWWVYEQTEWVDQPVDTPAKGEALRNENHAVQALARKLGVQVTQARSLDRLPPQGATLWLDSSNWNFFEGRDQALYRWVESGGHLVVPAWFLQDEGFQKWANVIDDTWEAEDDDDAEPADDADATEGSGGEDQGLPVPPPQAKDDDDNCPLLPEWTDGARAWPDREGLKVCHPGRDVLRTPTRPIWALLGYKADGAWALRVRRGQGTLTVVQSAPWNNYRLFEADHALLATAVLDFAPGRQVWWVTEESRESLWSLAWNRGWPALLAGLLLIAALVWRGTPRFGPPLGLPPLARRSMSEQVRGTAGFLGRHGRDALLKAQQRALDEAARLHVRNWARMDLRDRGRALAAATGLPESECITVLGPGPHRTTGEWLWALERLETARRRLRERRPGSPTPPTDTEIDKDKT